MRAQLGRGAVVERAVRQNLVAEKRRNSVKSASAAESSATAVHSTFIATGGCSAISRHSSARSTTRTMSRISAVSSTAPSMCAFSTSAVRFQQAGELEARAHAQILANLRGELLLALDPGARLPRAQARQSSPGRAGRMHRRGESPASSRTQGRGRWCGPWAWRRTMLPEQDRHPEC